jgi:ankyrin repeat protein
MCSEEKIAYLQLQMNSGVEESDLSPLMVASTNGDTEKVRLILNESTDDLNKKSVNGSSALHLACTCNHHLELVRLLIEKGADLNDRDKNEKTALMLVLERRYFKMAEFLIQHGADLNFADKDGNTALMIASRRFYRVEIVQMLLEKNADTNIQNKDGQTALIIAIDNEKFEIARVLIEHGANLDLMDKKGQTALMFVVQYGRIRLYQFENQAKCKSLTELMIRKGANLHCRFEGRSIFHLCAVTAHFNHDKLDIYRNALIKELSDTFKYTDIEKFKERFVESIDNQEVMIVDSDHV